MTSTGSPIIEGQQGPSGEFRFDKPEIPIPPFVEDIDLIVIDVVEDEEIFMSEEGHLFNGLLLVHGG